MNDPTATDWIISWLNVWFAPTTNIDRSALEGFLAREGIRVAWEKPPVFTKVQP